MEEVAIASFKVSCTIILRNFVVPDALSLVGDPLSGNGCGSPNHI